MITFPTRITGTSAGRPPRTAGARPASGWAFTGVAVTSSGRSASHQTVGKIFVYNGSSRWMYMSVNMYSGNGSVICQLVGTDGRVTTVGSSGLVDGYGYWGSPAPANLGPLASARLTSTDGTVVATASFSGA